MCEKCMEKAKAIFDDVNKKSSGHMMFIWVEDADSEVAFAGVMPMSGMVQMLSMVGEALNTGSLSSELHILGDDEVRH